MKDLPSLEMFPQITRVEIEAQDTGAVRVEMFAADLSMGAVHVNAAREPERLLASLDAVYRVLSQQSYRAKGDARAETAERTEPEPEHLR